MKRDSPPQAGVNGSFILDPQTIIIPSERMRSLLKAWLETDTIPELLERLDCGVGKLASPAA